MSASAGSGYRSATSARSAASSRRCRSSPLGPRFPHQRRQEVGEGVAPGQLVGPVGGDQQQWEGGQLPGEEAQQVEAGRIGPVQVLQHDHRRLVRRNRGEDAEHLAEERRLAAGLRVAGIGQRGGERGEPVAGRQAGQEFAPGTVRRGGAQVVAAGRSGRRRRARPPQR